MMPLALLVVVRVEHVIAWQVVVLLCVGGLVWMLWGIHGDEAKQFRLGISPEVWKAGRETVQRNMSATMWQRAERKLFGVRTRIEKKLNGSK